MTSADKEGKGAAWHEIVLSAPFHVTNLLTDALMDAGALSVTVEDEDVGTPNEKPQFDEPGADAPNYAWDNSRITALIDPSADAGALLKAACDACEIRDVPAYTLRVVPKEDWVRVTQAQFDPIKIGENIWIVPSWHDKTDKTGIVLELDPGIAFGTGSHPTTHLCLEWIEQNIQPGNTFLDYGCGSGILALAAARFGAKDVTGTDIDPDSVDTTHDNAAKNGCSVKAFVPDVFEKEYKGVAFDAVAANILAGPLSSLAPVISSHVADGGKLVLSGILEPQADDVIEAYRPYIALSVWKTMEGWVALTGRKKGAD